MSDSVIPWIKDMVNHAQGFQIDPIGNTSSQVYQADKSGRPMVLSDKIHKIRCVFETQALMAIQEKYGTQNFTGAVIMLKKYTIVRSCIDSKFLVHVSDAKILGSIGNRVFGHPVDINDDPEVREACATFLQEPIREYQTDGSQPSQSQNPLLSQRLDVDEKWDLVAALSHMKKDECLLSQTLVGEEEEEEDEYEEDESKKKAAQEEEESQQKLKQGLQEMERDSKAKGPTTITQEVSKDVDDFYGRSRRKGQKVIKSSQKPLEYSSDDFEEDEDEILKPGIPKAGKKESEAPVETERSVVQPKQEIKGKTSSQPETTQGSSVIVPESQPSQSQPRRSKRKRGEVKETPPAKPPIKEAKRKNPKAKTRKDKREKKVKMTAPTPPRKKQVTLTQFSQAVQVDSEEEWIGDDFDEEKEREEGKDKVVERMKVTHSRNQTKKRKSAEHAKSPEIRGDSERIPGRSKKSRSVKKIKPMKARKAIEAERMEKKRKAKSKKGKKKKAGSKPEVPAIIFRNVFSNEGVTPKLVEKARKYIRRQRAKLEKEKLSVTVPAHKVGLSLLPI
ncbi:hypothetical protein AAMO2058_000614200 [Amorphochlora amoebiformis]